MDFPRLTRLVRKGCIGIALVAGMASPAFATSDSGNDNLWAGVLKRRLASPPLFAGLASSTDIVFRDGFDGNNCTGNQTRTCYGGAGGTAGVGACSAGTQYCVDGQFGPCTGQIKPAAESCNGRDDNCDGNADNGLGTVTCGRGACQQSVAACSGGAPAACTPGSPSAEICDGIDNDCDGAIDEDGCGCVHVAPTGSDVTGLGTATSPLRTINAAIGHAATIGPNIVCVAADTFCLNKLVYPEAVVMKNGVHVYGGYQSSGATWPRNASCVTEIAAQDALGVSFDATIVDPTILDGFAISAQAAAATNAAITVKGSTGAMISNNTISGGNGTTSFGINVIDDGGKAATPTIDANVITGGNGAALAAGVRSLNSAPVVRMNCASTDASGRCNASCTGANRSIRARTVSGSGIDSDGIRLESSPGAVIDQNAVCASATSTADAAAIRIAGDAQGTVIRRNQILGGGGLQSSVGILADACAGASPWIVDNAQISASTTSNVAHLEGIRASGDCHPRIDSNVRVVGNVGAPANVSATGILCGKDEGSGISSRCTILGNAEISGSSAGTIAASTGVRCDDGACALIQDNLLISGKQGVNSTGISLGDTDAFIDENVVESGCGTSTGTGLLSDNSHARVQNNRISGIVGVSCPSTPSSSAAVEVLVGNSSNEIDLHSNDLFAGGVVGACTSFGIAFDLSAQAPPGARGIVRNNIVLPGTCAQSFDIAELDAAADPRVVQNNDLWKDTSNPTALYRNEAAVNLVTAADVNLMSDIVAGGNISADPSLAVDGHIAANSACRNTGTSEGGPLYDFDGNLRPQEAVFDIGMDEYHP